MQPSTRADFGKGIRAALPVLMGYVPVGMTFGLLARSTGMSFWETAGFSVFVFAGASQFMAINLIAAGAQAGEIIIATFLLNFRHFLMSGALVQRAVPEGDSRSDWLPHAPLVAFGVTDETFSVAMGLQERLTPALVGALNWTAWLAWLSGTLVGHVAGMALPSRLQIAMGTALYALFVALLVPQLKRHWMLAVPAIAAAVVNTTLVRYAGLPGGWALVATLIAVPAVAAAVLEV